MLSSRLVIWVVLAFLVLVEANAFCSDALGNATIYSVNDSEIQDFLRKFIANSVENVKMLVEFVTKLLRDALSGNGPVDRTIIIL